MDLFQRFQEELRRTVSNAFEETIEKKMPAIIRKASLKEWLTPSDIEREFKISRRSQQHLRDVKKLDYRKVGKRILVHRDEVERYLESVKIQAKN